MKSGGNGDGDWKAPTERAQVRGSSVVKVDPMSDVEVEMLVVAADHFLSHGAPGYPRVTVSSLSPDKVSQLVRAKNKLKDGLEKRAKKGLKS